MGFCPYVVTCFAYIQNPLILRLEEVFLERFFAHNNSHVVSNLFSPFFWHFLILIQTDHFAWAIAYASWPILAIFKILSFFEYFGVLWSVFFAQNNSNVIVQSYFAPFCPFYFLTQTEHFAKAIAFT